MHNDVIKIDANKIVKPKGKIFLVYFSSSSNNTHKFIQKLNFDNSRIPIDFNETILVDRDYVLFAPTYSGGGELTKGAVPKQVIKFLNNSNNRKHCKGIIASGNTNFGNTFAIAGPILSKKLQVPLLYQFELLGTCEDVTNVKKIIENFWNNK
ncbi:class Ib ribonucleoside-diphosphate reductase assembly flavoprotein NrdI [[Mycoplasma] collis]|uniref:class Ib ribonucleoside-diphosphate reductase assembly flavoprotein NrdI n=1 Tax=[Mycoplasma] collis TaxID=2127 RepID=UPI00051B4DFB|nr:class Ib ribonucleoside-diphosphate reductase assembly flavoprotein NrdI [[Mycoplasma] collis]